MLKPRLLMQGIHNDCVNINLLQSWLFFKVMILPDKWNNSKVVEVNADASFHPWRRAPYPPST